MVNLVYVSRGSDRTVIAGFGLGNFLINCVFNSLGFGLNMALETFVSQGFGVGNLKLCSVYLYKSRLIITVLFSLCCIIFFNVKDILIKLGQGEEVASNAQYYIQANLVALYLAGLIDGT